MEILQPKIEKHLYDILPQRDQVLQEMEEFGKVRDFPIVGPLVGRLLCQLTLLTKAKRILEMGSGYGYSAYWFARAIKRGGRVICTEGDPQNKRRALNYFERGGIDDKIEFLVGNALNIIDELKGKFDIIFIDINKSQYPQAFRKALPRLRKGGLLIADNIIWSGRIVEPNPDDSTQGILEFTKLLYTSKQLFTTIIPLRDGVSVSIKL